MSFVDKKPAVRKVTDKIALKNFGRTKTKSFHEGICVSCGRDASLFKDKISKKEYKISGFCQICQDKVFGTCDKGVKNSSKTKGNLAYVSLFG